MKKNIIDVIRPIIIDFFEKKKDNVKFSLFKTDNVWKDLGFNDYSDFKNQLETSNYILAWSISELMSSFMDKNYCNEFLLYEENDDYTIYVVSYVDDFEVRERFFKIIDFNIIEVEKTKKIIEITEWKEL